jgi:metal-sulfur cluster biosynthetic enzyme
MNDHILAALKTVIDPEFGINIASLPAGPAVVHHLAQDDSNGPEHRVLRTS